MDELPAGYDGESWRNKKLQDYYSKVTEAQKVNHWIEEAKTLKDNYESKVNSLTQSAEGEKSKIKLKFNDQRQDIKDIIDISKSKIDRSKEFINNSDRELELKIKELTNDEVSKENKLNESYQNSLSDLEKEYKAKKEEIISQYSSNVKSLESDLVKSIDSAKKNLHSEVEEQKELIGINENKIAAKEQELISLNDLEKAEMNAADEKLNSEIKEEKTKLGKASEYLENNTLVSIEPLQAQAEEIERMQSYLREFDKMIEIRDGKLQKKKDYSSNLTIKIEKARELPTELLKTAKMPIEGISVDINGLIRINRTLIDGLSDGEKLELSLIIAKAQCGELKLICLDRFESLNDKARKDLIEQMIQDDYQYILTSTESDEFKIVQFDSEEEIKNYFNGGQE